MNEISKVPAFLRRGKSTKNFTTPEPLSQFAEAKINAAPQKKRKIKIAKQAKIAPSKKGKEQKRIASKAIGKVVNYLPKIKVAIMVFSVPVTAGTAVYLNEGKRRFKQKLTSLQHNHKNIPKAPKGKEVGVKVNGVVKKGDKIYSV